MAILQQAQESGVIKVLKQHNLSYSVFSRWKQQLAAQKLVEFEGAVQLKRENELLGMENTQLKKIIADQALELERKDEELKRNNPMYGKR